MKPHCPRCAELEDEIRFLRRQMGLEHEDGLAGLVAQRLGIGLGATRILLMLHAARGRSVKTNQLMIHVGEGCDTGVIRTQVYRLRKCLGDVIGTIYGSGYALTPEGVARVDDLISDRLRPARSARPRACTEPTRLDGLPAPGR